MSTTNKMPMENLQEVNLDDSDSDSSSSDEELETFHDEDHGNNVSQAPAPAPSPIPLSTSTFNSTTTNSTASYGAEPRSPPSVVAPQPPMPTSSPTRVRDIPPVLSAALTSASKPVRGLGKVKTPQRETGSLRGKRPGNKRGDEEEDVSSRAAVALAAVAAAATANNSSPSAAAQAARAVAQTFVRGAKSGNANNTNSPNPSHHVAMNVPPKPKPIVAVKLHLVKEQLSVLCTGEEDEDESLPPPHTPLPKYPFLERLANGENDSFLQHLLMLSYYRVAEEDLPAGNSLRPTVAIIDDNGNVQKPVSAYPSAEQEDPDTMVAEEAANDIFSLWKKIDGAYSSMGGMLPKCAKASHHNNRSRSSLEDRVLEVPQSSEVEADNEAGLKDDFYSDGSVTPPVEASDNSFASDDEVFESEPEKPIVIPDLLPPCTSATGDATIEFFRACQGHLEMDESASSIQSSGRHSSPERKTTKKATPSSPQTATTASSMFSSMFSATRRGSETSTSTSATTTSSIMGSGAASLVHSIKMPTFTGASLPNMMFPRRGNRNSKAGDHSRDDKGASESDKKHKAGEYTVTIEKEMLGLTVENVLERTVVRTVLAGGPAKKAGAKVGSLIVKVGSVETKNLTHFETIDELRQSQRPLQLVLRVISDDALRSAREEMGRLIRGSGYGMLSNGMGGPNANPLVVEHSRSSNENRNPALNPESKTLQSGEQPQGKPLIGSDLRVDAYSSLIRERFEAVAHTKNKKEETLEQASEKLVWILTLFVIGLQREADHLFSLAGTQENPQDDGSDAGLSASPGRRHSYSSTSLSYYHHTAKDYTDAAKSVSKILLDFVKKNLDPGPTKKPSPNDYSLGGPNGARNRRKGPPSPDNRRQPMVPGMQQSSPQSDSTILHDKPLLQIGDMLHRTRSFLADTTSPPAALLRGELISFLCDVLDIDTEMELSEEEAVSQTAGHGKAGPITDLGSAGSLLKLIVLNCSVMRSPDCESISGGRLDDELMQEMNRRFGGNAKLDGADVHRLHAGNRFLSVVHRLAASRSISARITACSLGPVLWGHLDFPHQLQLRGVITRALHDADVIVRKSTATVLHEIAELVFDRRAVPWLVLMCERAMTDPEPQLRSAAMTLTWHLAEHLPNAFLGDASQGSRFVRRLPERSDPIFADVYLLQCKLLPVATRLAEDRAPAVRLAVAAQCDRLCNALGDHWFNVIIDVLLAMMSDTDERVKSEAVLCVPRLAESVLMSSSNRPTQKMDVSVLESLLPAAIVLQKDKHSSVRVSLATAAGELLTLLVGLQSLEEAAAGSDSESPSASAGLLKKHVDDVLIPLVQGLLHDKDPEVTSSALRAVTNASRGTVREIRQRHMSMASEDDSVSVSSHMSTSTREKKEPVFLPVLSEAQVLRLLPTLSELGKSRQWRVRQSAVEIVPALLGCTRNADTRSEIAQLCIRLMADQVDAVRKTAAECLCLGGGSLGSHGESIGAEWITTIVIPHIRKCAMHPNAKQRLLSLKMIEAVLLNGACPAKWKGNEEGERLADSPMRELAVVALSLAKDKVPNVRLNVGRVLEASIHVFEEDALGFVKEVLLQQLAAEKERPGGGDRDVLFFATRCIQKARMILEASACEEVIPL